MRAIVSNTGPLISLENLATGFDLLRKLYDQVLITPDVLHEISAKYPRSDIFLEQFNLKDLLVIASPTHVLQNIPLHAGEISAISLAYEMKLPLLIEERAGRRIAKEKGIIVSGIAGQIAQVKFQHLISRKQAISMMDEMLDAKRIDVDLHQTILDMLN